MTSRRIQVTEHVARTSERQELRRNVVDMLIGKR